MKAINLPFYKSRLMEISKEIHLEQDWKLPTGLIERGQSNPLNFTRAQWEHAKRLDDDPRLIKAALKDCWAVSNDKETFQNKLEERGYYLAKGDRRGFVAVDWRGEVFSLSKWLDVKTKELKERFGEPEQLPSVEETKANIDTRLVERVQQFTSDIRKNSGARMEPLLEQKTQMVDRHQNERINLDEMQRQRWHQESEFSQTRLNTGIRGLWDRLTGQHSRITEQNEEEAWQAVMRDRQQRDELIQRQLQERLLLQLNINHVREAQDNEMEHLKTIMFSTLPADMKDRLQKQFEQSQSRQSNLSPSYNSGYDLSM